MLDDIEKLSQHYFIPNWPRLFCLTTICKTSDEYGLRSSTTNIHGVFSLKQGKYAIWTGKEIIRQILKTHKAKLKWVKNQIGRNIWIQTLRNIKNYRGLIYEVQVILSSELSMM